MSETTLITDAPFDIHFCIAQFLPAKSFYHLVLSCRSFSYLCSSVAMWSRVFVNVLKTELTQLSLLSATSIQDAKRMQTRRGILNGLIRKQQSLMKRIVTRANDEEEALQTMKKSIVLHVMAHVTNDKQFHLSNTLSMKFNMDVHMCHPQDWYTNKYHQIFEIEKELRRLLKIDVNQTRSIQHQVIMDRMIQDLSYIYAWRPDDVTEQYYYTKVPDCIVDTILERIDYLVKDQGCSVLRAFMTVPIRNKRIMERCLELRELEMQKQGITNTRDSLPLRLLVSHFDPETLELVLSKFPDEIVRDVLASQLLPGDFMKFDFVHNLLERYQVPPSTFNLPLHKYIMAETANKKRFEYLKSYIERGLKPKLFTLLYDSRFRDASFGLEMFQYLLDNGADPNETEGSCILVSALSCSFDVEYIAMLIKYGADVNTQFAWRGTCLLYLCQYIPSKEKDLAYIELIVKSGADVNYVHDSFNPLRLIYLHGERSFEQAIQIIRLLREHGARWELPEESAADLHQFLLTHIHARNSLILEDQGFHDLLPEH